ncbi:protein GLUTAMINE DUMPER 5 [Canna indica]|uniref:Protein GLUTAMINE DUMPER 5 n=1 Tax=Canna indica TaxID=4628 RepID=A0AAQ3KSZ5_9LILI|nr:protein GLUTAMINE DUMPER 5 [Canna indica]
MFTPALANIVLAWATMASCASPILACNSLRHDFACISSSCNATHQVKEMRGASGFNAPTVAAVSGPAVSTGGASGGGSHSAWHSPVPYLFGGFAAMLGLIAFALLILACSYWKLSGYLDGGNGDDDNAEAGGGAVELYVKPVATAALLPARYETKIVVIMAGDEKPTFLATPVSSRASSQGGKENGGEEKREEEDQGVAGDTEQEPKPQSM